MPASTFNCPACGAPLELTTSDKFVKCPFCHNTVVVPFDLLRNVLHPVPADQEVGQQEQQVVPPLLPITAEENPAFDPDLVNQKVIDLIHQGKKIEAIKELRLAYPIGLVEAKRIADALEAGQPFDLKILEKITSPQTGSIGPDLLAKIKQYLLEGQKIEAIKAYRNSSNVGLKEAKDAVDEMEAAILAEGGQIVPHKSTPSNSSKLLLVLFIIVAGIIFIVSMIYLAH